MCVCVCVCVCVVCRYDKERLRTKLLEVCNPRKSPTKMLFYQTHMMVFFSFTSNFLLRNSSYVYIQRYLSKLYKAVSYIYFCGNWNIPKGKNLTFLQCLIYMLVSRLGINICVIPRRITPSSAINLVNIF